MAEAAVDEGPAMVLVSRAQNVTVPGTPRFHGGGDKAVVRYLDGAGSLQCAAPVFAANESVIFTAK